LLEEGWVRGWKLGGGEGGPGEVGLGGMASIQALEKVA